MWPFDAKGAGCPCTCNVTYPNIGIYIWSTTNAGSPLNWPMVTGGDGEGCYCTSSAFSRSSQTRAQIDCWSNENGWGSCTYSKAFLNTDVKGQKQDVYIWWGVPGEAPGALFTVRYTGDGSVYVNGFAKDNTGTGTSSGMSDGSGAADGQACQNEPDLDFHIGVQQVQGRCEWQVSSSAGVGVKVGASETGVDLTQSSSITGNWNYTALNGWSVLTSREGCMGAGATIILVTTAHSVGATASVVGDGSLLYPTDVLAHVESVAGVGAQVDNLRRCDR